MPKSEMAETALNRIVTKGLATWETTKPEAAAVPRGTSSSEGDFQIRLPITKHKNTNSPRNLLFLSLCRRWSSI